MKHLFSAFCCLAAFSLQALPPWLTIQSKDGSLQFEQIPARLLHFTPKWYGREQSAKFVKGKAEQTASVFRFSGTWTIEKQKFQLNETIRQTAPDQVEYTAEVQSGTPIPTQELSLNLQLPLEFLNKKTIIANGETIRYAETPSRKNNRWFNGLRSLIVELPEGKLEISGKPFRALLQDNRVFAKKGSKASPGTYSLRLYPQSGDLKTDTKVSFRYCFKFHGITSAPLDLGKAANRAFRDERSGDGKGGWNDQGPENDLRMFKPGGHRYFGVNFQVTDPDRNDGKGCIVLNGADRTCFLDSATIQCAGQRGRWLYLLHANAFTGKYKHAGTIEIRFRDGSRQKIDVRNNIDIGNWWGGIDRENAPVVWKSTNSKSVVGLYMTGFRLERDDPAEITFRKGEFPVWMIVAASLTDRKAEPYRISNEYYILPGAEWVRASVQDVKPGTPLDFSRFADAPAGKYGRIILSKDGKFTFEQAENKRIRLLGVNICGSANFPDRTTAEQFAEKMAQAGYNTVRIHHFENGLHNGKGSHSYEFDPAQLDRLDYLIHCLKQKGIYTTLDLYASRTIKPGELPEFGSFKVGVCFVDAYLKNWQEFTSRLLNHVNPYTKMRWADDPAVFCLNLVNENPLINIWRRGNESVILAEYTAWLKQQGLDSAENREKRTGPFMQFLTEKQSGTIRRMTDYIRNTLKSDILITDINCDTRPYLAHSRNMLDLVDMHYYLDHPTHPHGGWNPPSVFTQLSSICRYAENPREMMPARIFGKPFLVTEYQFCHPNNYIAESGPLMGAYSALQDWDGLWRFQYALSDRGLLKTAGWVSYFTSAGNPTMRMSDYIIWFLFIRGDVRPAEKGIALPLDASLFDRESSLSAYSRLGLIHRIGMLPPGEKQKNITVSTDPEPKLKTGTVISSTKEIVLNPAQEFKVITPKSECITTDKPEAEAGRLSFRRGSTFQTLSVHSLDALPLGTSSSLLLFHLTDVKNSSEKFASPDMTYLLSYGRAPALQRVGTADISLRLPAGNWRVMSLNPDGTVKRTENAVWRNGTLQFRANTGNTLVYHIVKQ